MVETNLIGSIDLAVFKVLVFEDHGTPFSLGVKFKIVKDIDFLISQLLIAIIVLL